MIFPHEWKRQLRFWLEDCLWSAVMGILLTVAMILMIL